MAEKAETCEQCGRDLPESEICTHCGHDNHRRHLGGPVVKQIRREVEAEKGLTVND